MEMEYNILVKKSTVCSLQVSHTGHMASVFDLFNSKPEQPLQFSNISSDICTDSKAVFTLNVNYIQLNYDSIYHTPLDFIQLWFCSHLRKLKKTRQGDLAI